MLLFIVNKLALPILKLRLRNMKLALTTGKKLKLILKATSS